MNKQAEGSTRLFAVLMMIVVIVAVTRFCDGSTVQAIESNPPTPTIPSTPQPEEGDDLLGNVEDCTQETKSQFQTVMFYPAPVQGNLTYIQWYTKIIYGSDEWTIVDWINNLSAYNNWWKELMYTAPEICRELVSINESHANLVSMVLIRISNTQALESFTETDQELIHNVIELISSKIDELVIVYLQDLNLFFEDNPFDTLPDFISQGNT